MAIVVHDVDLASTDGIWSPAFAGKTQAARQLIRAFDGQARTHLRYKTAYIALRQAARAAHLALGSAFGEEIEELAGLFDVEPVDVLIGNLAYDLTHLAGCSTFVRDTAEGPIHARNLDWPFPGTLLRKHTCVVRFRNAPAGDYAAVTWPGLFGVLTGVAPGRFAVTVNFVRHVEDSAPTSVIKRVIAGNWPVTWAVRHALDTQTSFAGAVRFLKTVPLLAPVLFTVAGIVPGEGVVIERSATTSSTRKISEGSVCVANHYVSSRQRTFNADLEEMDTCQRFEHLESNVPGMEADVAGAMKLLKHARLLSSNTQHHVVMRARDGLLAVRVPGQRTQRISVIA